MTDALPPRPRAVPLAKAYRLLNHGPTVLLSAAHGGRRNTMAAAWTMPLDFDPPKVAVVIDKAVFTRGLVEASGRFALSLPCAAQRGLVDAVGGASGRSVDKEAAFGLGYLAGEAALAGSDGLPLVAGCVAWLACRRLPQPDLEQAHDLFLAQVEGAWADPRVFSQGRWHFDGHDALRTLHHVAGGAYFTPGPLLQG